MGPRPAARGVARHCDERRRNRPGLGATARFRPEWVVAGYDAVPSGPNSVTMPRRLARLGLALAALHVGCGTGISVDPTSVDPPHTETGDDGGKIHTIDAAEDIGPAEGDGPSDARARDGDGAAE